MPNPTITAWAPGATFTVAGSTFAAADVRVADIANAPVSIVLTLPAGATVQALRDPGSWSVAGTELLGAGGWATGLITVGGEWTATVAPGGVPTAPATVTVTDPDGTHPSGTLRLVFRGLAAANAVIEPAGGTLSIDRVIADPSILNPQVTSTLPVTELDPVTLGAAVQATQSANPAPALTLAALPALGAAWSPEPGNAAAVSNFAPAGATASFQAPAAYAPLNLSFRLAAVLDLDGAGLGSAANPRREEVLALTVQTVTHAMVLVLDRSGSMGATFGSGLSRWDAAVRAAHAWLDLFRAFRPANTHRAGIVTFEHDGCGWTLSAADDVTLRNPADAAAASSMSPLPGFGDVAVLQLGNVASCTPVGDALVAAYKAVGDALLAGSGAKKASILLLTDGYENSGRVTIAKAKGSAATTLDLELATPAFAFPKGLVSDRRFTIAVGSQVDQDRLNDLGAGWYQLTSETKQLLPAYAEMLGKVLDAERERPIAGVADPASPSHALYFLVSAGEQHVSFLVPWSAATDDLAVAWRLQGSTDGFTPVNPTGTGVRYFQRQTHGLLVVPIGSVTGTTAATVWRLQHISPTAVLPGPQPLTDADALCMVDLVVKAEVGFDRRQYFIGDSIRLSCRISNGGARVAGASIVVDVARPGEGLGTFLATNAGRYQEIIRDPPAAIVRRADRLQGKGLMHATLLHVLGLDALPVISPPAMKLLDDGGHGDGAADDGDYANAFTDTAKEGTYTFRFRIEGTLPDGSRFSRLFVRSTWVGVRPSPAALGAVWTALQGLPGGQAGSLLTFTPRSASGEYLGPFRAVEIGMTVSHGRFDGDLVDNLDGSYSRRVLHDRDRPPIVSIEIYGEKMDPTGPGLDQGKPGADARNCGALWTAAILCTLRGILRLFGWRL